MVTKMNKTEAIRKLSQAAKTYDRLLCGKNLLIIFNNPSKPLLVETKAIPTNFLHLTGVEVDKDNILKDVEDPNSNYKEIFYQKCLNNKLRFDDFEFKKDGTTEQKLDCLDAALNVQKNSKMIGDYNNNRIYLKTNKFVGGVNCCLGLYAKNGYFVPNTVINGDIRNEVYQYSQVLAILSKEIGDEIYNEIKFVNRKRVDINKLLQTIKKDVNISPKLLTENAPSASAYPTALSEKNKDLEQQKQPVTVAAARIPQSSLEEPEVSGNDEDMTDDEDEDMEM